MTAIMHPNKYAPPSPTKRNPRGKLKINNPNKHVKKNQLNCVSSESPLLKAMMPMEAIIIKVAPIDNPFNPSIIFID